MYGNFVLNSEIRDLSLYFNLGSFYYNEGDNYFILTNERNNTELIIYLNDDMYTYTLSFIDIKITRNERDMCR